MALLDQLSHLDSSIRANMTLLDQPSYWRALSEPIWLSWISRATWMVLLEPVWLSWISRTTRMALLYPKWLSWTSRATQMAIGPSMPLLDQASEPHGQSRQSWSRRGILAPIEPLRWPGQCRRAMLALIRQFSQPVSQPGSNSISRLVRQSISH